MDPITAGLALVALLTAAGGIYYLIDQTNLAGSKLQAIEQAVAKGTLSPTALINAPGGSSAPGSGGSILDKVLGPTASAAGAVIPLAIGGGLLYWLFAKGGSAKVKRMLQ
jgi:hypothetical protein